MKIVKWVLLVLAILLVVAQAIRPDMTNPPVNPTHTIQAWTSVPPDVDAILRRSCYDCHSSETRWPWYAQISPVSWWLKDDVSEGRREVSFSEFATYSNKKARKKFEEICEQVNKGEMPLELYVPLHPEAKLSSADRNRLCDWANSEKARLPAAK